MATATIYAGGVNAPVEIDTKDIMRITYERVGDARNGRTDGLLHMITGSTYTVGQPTVTKLKALDPTLAEREIRK